MPVNIHGKEYYTVVERMEKMNKKTSGDYSLNTELIKLDSGFVVVKATLSFGGNEYAGHAMEEIGSSQINTTSALENCETSAIGRSLASAGFHGTEFCSANELENALQQQKQSKPTKRSGGMSQVAAELDEKYDGSEGIDLEKEMTTEDVANNLGGEVIGDDVEPKIKNIVNFGTKYKGKDWSEADDGYVNWCSGKDGKGGSVVDWQKQQGLEEWERRNSKKEDNPIPE